ncbi:hypothetical protein B0H16DRAFT_1707453 [Mycena metata]|uniref:Uncharacterized protein n=1 Tax=Mycena metata TaxID=1033252 RepID=A0AAD7GHX0_9AGAR|nr:hypothetical protein B0H16DRAFT_1707453 [Mycena metata]
MCALRIQRPDISEFDTDRLSRALDDDTHLALHYAPHHNPGREKVQTPAHRSHTTIPKRKFQSKRERPMRETTLPRTAVNECPPARRATARSLPTHVKPKMEIPANRQEKMDEKRRRRPQQRGARLRGAAYVSTGIRDKSSAGHKTAYTHPKSHPRHFPNISSPSPLSGAARATRMVTRTSHNRVKSSPLPITLHPSSPSPLAQLNIPIGARSGMDGEGRGKGGKGSGTKGGRKGGRWERREDEAQGAQPEATCELMIIPSQYISILAQGTILASTMGSPSGTCNLGPLALCLPRTSVAPPAVA